MASITTILGTHSLSSSRLTINDNFDNVNEELGYIANVLDTTNSTLSLTGLISAGSISLTTGSLSTFNVTSTTLTAGVPAVFQKVVTLEKTLLTSFGDTLTFPTSTPSLGAYNYTGTGSITLGASASGQLLTIVSSNAAGFTISLTGEVHGATAISVDTNGSISLLGDDSGNGKWYIVGSFKATIS